MVAKILGIIIFISCVQTSIANVWSQWVRAIHMVETSGQIGLMYGDERKSLGPLQIQYNFHYDAWSGAGTYSKCVGLQYARATAYKYLSRYCYTDLQVVVSARSWQEALPALEHLSRIFNGGPEGHMKTSTEMYWRKVKRELSFL